MRAAMALAALAARTGFVSRTWMVTMLIGATAVLTAGGGEKTETPVRSRLAVSPRPICRATWANVSSAVPRAMAARGSVLRAEMELPLASVGWPRYTELAAR